MHRIRITLSVLLCALAAFCLASAYNSIAAGAGKNLVSAGSAKGATDKAEREEADDPDLPPGMAGKINKADYLRQRADYVNMRRGRPYDLAYDPHEKAINEMSRQEAGVARKIKLAGSAVTPTWTWMGPAPIANGQTSGVVSPVSGRTISIAVHPTNPDIVYAGAAQGGLKKSIDGGDHWVDLFTFQLESLAIGSITIDPTDPNIVYIGTGENGQCADCFAGVGLYIIRNAESGTPTLSGPFRQNGAGDNVFLGRSIGKIIVNSADHNVIFVATGIGTAGNPSAGAWATPPPRGIYRSTNAQSATPTFEQVAITGLPVQDRTVTDLSSDPNNANVLIAGVVGETGNPTTEGGIYRSTDALAPTPTFARTRVISTDTTVGGGVANGRVELYNTGTGATMNVYAAVGEFATLTNGNTANCVTSQRAGYVTKSTDGGATWSAPIPTTSGFCGGQCFYDMAIAVTPDNSTIHLAGAARGGNGTTPCTSDVMKRSTNGGTTFVRNDTGLHADSHGLAIAPSNPAVVYASNDGGIWRSGDNGNTWVAKNNATYSATQFQSLDIHPFDRWFTIGGTQDNGTNGVFSNTTTWQNVVGGDGGNARIDDNAQDATNVTMYHTFFNQTGSQILFERADNTSFAWLRFGCGGTANGINCADAVLFYAPLELGPGNPNTVYFGTDKLYRSEDKGVTMPAVSQVLDPAASAANRVLTTIAISPQDDNVRLVGTRSGKVFATTTGSSTLTDVTSPAFPPQNPAAPAGRRAVGRAMIDPNNKFTGYITFSSYGLPPGQHIWKTQNLNANPPTWVASSNGIPDVPVNAMVIDPVDSNSIYVGTDIGVYHSTDGGANWAPFGTGLPRVAVFDMQISKVQRILRIATHGRGIWEISIGGTLLPVLRTESTQLTAESCGSGNGNIDPGETVTLRYTVRNIGPGTTTNLTATLLAGGGVTSPSGPVNLGMVGPNGTTFGDFTFTASGSCAGTITLVFKFAEGATDLGTQSITFTLGQTVPAAPTFTENFDSVTPPALPAGWVTTNSGAAVPWTTTTAFSQTPPNSAGSSTDAIAAATGQNDLTSPAIPIPAAPSTGSNPRVQLSFQNNYNTEGGFDGMVLEISINGGAFQDILAAGGSFEQGGYNSVFNGTPGLAGRQGWTGDSGGFVPTVVNLPASSYGQNAQLRWRCSYDSNTAPAGSGTRIDTVSIYAVSTICCLPTPNPISAVSRKSHNGPTFDVDLLTGSRIECRAPGAGNSHQVIVTFPATVTVGGVTVTSKDGLAMATQSVAGPVVTINLTGVTDAQSLGITLQNVSDGGTPHNVALSMTVLAGDTNQDSRVNVSDVNQTKSFSGQTTSATNFRADVNTDGRINVSDVNFVKGHAGSSVPFGQDGGEEEIHARR